MYNRIITHAVQSAFLILSFVAIVTKLPYMIKDPIDFDHHMKLLDVQWLGPVAFAYLVWIYFKTNHLSFGWSNRIFKVSMAVGLIAYGSQILNIVSTNWLFPYWQDAQVVGRLVMEIALRLPVILCLIAAFFIIQSASKTVHNTSNDEFGASRNHGKFKAEKFRKRCDIDNYPKNSPGDILLCWDRATGEPIIIPEKDRSLHLFCAGPTGSGKSSTVVLPMIYQDLKVPNSGVGLIEPKGDIAEAAYKMALYLGRKDVIFFNPVDKHTVYFNPLDPMNGSDLDVINLMTTVYDGMAGGSNTDPFFHKNSMMVLRKSLDLLLRLKRLENSVLTIKELSKFLTGKTSMLTYCRKLASYRRPEDEALLTWFYEELLADTKNAQNNQTYYVGLKQEIELLADLPWLNGDPKTGRSQLNFDELLANGGVFFANTALGDLGTMGNYLGQFLIMSFQNAVFRRPGNENTRKPFYMYIDEFSLYANDNFERWLALARSYRCPAHLFTQGTAQLDKVSVEFKKSAINNCRHKVIFAPEEKEEATYWSDYFGEVYKEKISRSTSSGSSRRWSLGLNMLDNPDNVNDSESESVSQELVKNYTPTDIMNLPFQHVIYKTVKQGTNQVARYGVTDFIPKHVYEAISKMDLDEVLASRAANNPDDSEETEESFVFHL